MLDQKKIKSVMDNWQQPPSAEGDWQPLPDDYPNWKPLEETWKPIDEIQQQRNGDPQSILTPECRDKIGDWWNGNNLHTADCPCGAHSCSEGPLHYHCYPTSAHAAWHDWRALLPMQPHHKPWRCCTLKNAADHYSWTHYPYGSFDQLAAALQSAMHKGDQLLTAVVCKKILDWGGVLNRSAGSIRWIHGSQDLIGDIRRATASLCPQSTISLTSIFGPALPAIPMNSGSTKIFSAAALVYSSNFSQAKQDVIIFDGRVSAGLGLLARRILYPTPIPNQFRFPRPAEAHRNASIPGYVVFPLMSTKTDLQRAEFSRIASRCVQDVLGQYQPSNDFVQAEKALFMIGYNVTKLCCGCPRPVP